MAADAQNAHRGAGVIQGHRQMGHGAEDLDHPGGQVLYGVAGEGTVVSLDSGGPEGLQPGDPRGGAVLKGEFKPLHRSTFFLPEWRRAAPPEFLVGRRTGYRSGRRAGKESPIEGRRPTGCPPPPAKSAWPGGSFGPAAR